MKTVYIKGERTYLLGNGKAKDDIETAKNVAVVKHNDVVERINQVFRFVGDGRYDDFTAVFLKKIIEIFTALPDNLQAWEIPIRISRYKDITFQDKKGAQSLAMQAKRLKAVHIDGLNAGGLRVIKASLPRMQETKEYEDAVLSDEFKAWRREQRAKT